MVLRRLREAGHAALFAGGCVRDELLGLAPKDYDIATDATPQRIAELFPRALSVGAAFGVMIVRQRPRPQARAVNVEVATFRADGEYRDRRRPERVHFTDAEHDARRRDFTANALFIDPLEPDTTLADAAGAGADAGAAGASGPRPRLVATARGRVIDYVGGVADLAAGVLRAVGDAEQRLAEDHLRALRAVRFTARLGFSLESSTATAIARHAAELRGVSRERIGEELRKMLTHPGRVEAARLVEDLGLDAPALDEPRRAATAAADAGAASRFSALAALPAEASFGSAVAAWAQDRHAGPGQVLTPEQGAPVVARWRAALCLSNLERAEMVEIIDVADRLARLWPTLREAQRKRAAVRDGFEVAFKVVGARAPACADRVRVSLMRLGYSVDGRIGPPPLPLLTGDELVAHGFRPGPAFKMLLEQVYDAQLEGRVTTGSEALAMAMELRRTGSV